MAAPKTVEKADLPNGQFTLKNAHYKDCLKHLPKPPRELTLESGDFGRLLGEECKPDTPEQQFTATKLDDGRYALTLPGTKECIVFGAVRVRVYGYNVDSCDSAIRFTVEAAPGSTKGAVVFKHDNPPDEVEESQSETASSEDTPRPQYVYMGMGGDPVTEPRLAGDTTDDRTVWVVTPVK